MLQLVDAFICDYIYHIIVIYFSTSLTKFIDVGLSALYYKSS